MSLTMQEAKDLMFEVYNTVAIANNLETIWPDLPGDPPGTEIPWARIMLRHQDGNQASLGGDVGQRCWEMVGLLTVQLFTPFGGGAVNAYSIGQQLLAAYRGSNSAIWYTNPRVREIGRDGSFAQANFIVDFNYSQIQ